MKLILADVRSIITDRPLRNLIEWMTFNRYTAIAWPVVLVLEGILLFQLELSAGAMGWVGVSFFFLSFTAASYATSIGRELSQVSHSRVEEHVWYVNTMGITLLMGVVATECSVRASGGLWGPLWLLVTHFMFVSGALVSYVIARFVLTGLKNPKRHKVWAYMFLVTFGMTLLLGTSLFFLKFPFQ
jgi:hypothetical protein